MTEIDQELCWDQPAVVALCREADDGGEQLAGWLMVLTDRAVAYVPGRNGSGALLGTFSSLTSAERLLGHGGLYVVEAASTDDAADRVGPEARTVARVD